MAIISLILAYNVNIFYNNINFTWILINHLARILMFAQNLIGIIIISNNFH